MDRNLVIIGPGRYDDFPADLIPKNKPKVQFLVIEKLGAVEFLTLSQAVDEVSKFDRSKDIARIVINRFDRFVGTYENAFLSEEEMGFSGFRGVVLDLMGDLLYLSNAVYTFVQHNRVAIKRDFGKASAELSRLWTY